MATYKSVSRSVTAVKVTSAVIAAPGPFPDFATVKVGKIYGVDGSEFAQILLNNSWNDIPVDYYVVQDGTTVYLQDPVTFEALWTEDTGGVPHE